jgi:adenylate cyclase
MHDPCEILRFGDYEIDFGRRELRQAGAPVPLSLRPLRLLLHLAQHRDRALERRELFDAVWGEVVVGDESLTQALAEVRRAVGDSGDSQRVIRTQKGIGYRFVAEVTLVRDESAPPASPAREPSAEAPVALLQRRLGTRAWLAAAGALALTGIATAVLLRGARPPPAHPPFGVAVLPVAPLTASAADRELADGLTEQITQTLAANGYPVVARTTAAQYRERAADVRELGATLGVSHVLEGSVRRSAGRVRVTLQLIATDTGKHVWSEAFEETGDDAFAIEDRVTNRAAVQVQRLVWEDAVAWKRDPQLVEASELVVQSRKLFLEGRWEDHIALAERVLARIPEREPFLRYRGDTLATLSLAWSNLYAFAGSKSFREASAPILSHAEQAVALAPESAWAHASLARALTDHWRWDGAERELERACELAPRAADACGGFRWYVCGALGCASDHVEGARMGADAMPGYGALRVGLSSALLNTGRLDEALTASTRAGELGAPELQRARILWRLGRRDEAVEALHALSAAFVPEVARELETQRAAEPEAAWRSRASRLAAQPAGPFSPSPKFSAALFFAELGDYDAAMNALERSVAAHEPGFALNAIDVILDPIRETPRFRALLDRMNLTPYHEKYGVFERTRRRMSAPHSEATP